MDFQTARIPPVHVSVNHEKCRPSTIFELLEGGSGHKLPGTELSRRILPPFSMLVGSHIVALEKDGSYVLSLAMFVVGLFFLIESKCNGRKMIRLVKKSDAREMQTSYQHCHNKYIQALQNVADKADQ